MNKITDNYILMAIILFGISFSSALLASVIPSVMSQWFSSVSMTSFVGSIGFIAAHYIK